jgi:quercetin dioxygenase-like cupin family protein
MRRIATTPKAGIRAAPRLIVNPRSGERIRVLTTAAETGGELFAFELELRPHGQIPSAHRHPQQVERFTVLDGQATFRLGRRRVVAQAGESVCVPLGTVHRIRNDGEKVARLRVEVRPALHMEEMLATAAELFGYRRTLRTPLDLAVFVRDYAAEVQAPFAAGVLRAITAPLARADRGRHPVPATRARR